MIRIGGLEFKYPESFEDVREMVSAFCDWYSASYDGNCASSTFAHIVLDDLNLGDDYIYWCLEWEQIRFWIEDEMEQIDDGRGTKYAQAVLKKQVLQKAAAIIRFLNDLTIIPEEIRVEYTE